MVNSRSELSRAQGNSNLRTWMLFVDGENFAIEGQKLAAAHRVTLLRGAYHEPDVFVWFPNQQAGLDASTAQGPPPLKRWPVRAYYYTMTAGTDAHLGALRELIWNRGFQPEVFHKPKGTKAKGVDITLTRDMLSHAFRDNYDAAVLVAGDGDYVPLVEEVKRLGKVVCVAFFPDNGLNQTLRLASDEFIRLDTFFVNEWRRATEGAAHTVAEA